MAHLASNGPVQPLSLVFNQKELATAGLPAAGPLPTHARPGGQSIYMYVYSTRDLYGLWTLWLSLHV